MEDKKDKKDKKNKNIEKKIDKMRSYVSDKEKCKIIAKKLTEYIKKDK